MDKRAKNTKLLELATKREYWKENPDKFLEEVLDMQLPKHQKNIIKAFVKYDKMSVCSANGIGKSRLLSALIVAFFFCYFSSDKDENVIVVFAAPTFAQVKDNIYDNFKDLMRRADDYVFKKYGVDSFAGKLSENQNTAEFKYGDKNFVKGISASGENKAVGKHGVYVLQVFDEAQGIEDKIYSDFRGISKSGLIVKEIMIGNSTIPAGKAGRFYDSFKEKSKFHKIKISAFDTDAFVETNIKLEDYLCDEDDYDFWRNKVDRYCGTDYKTALKEDNVSKWEREVKLKLPFGKFLINPIEVENELIECGMNPDSYEFLTRVLAEFPKEDSASLFKHQDIEDSFNNYNNEKFHISGKRIMGIDVASGLGRDMSAISIVDGNKVIYLEQFNYNAIQLEDKVKELHEEYKPSQINIERDGVGKPIYDHLVEAHLPVNAIVSGSAPGIKDDYGFNIETNKELKEQFQYKRDELWWNLRKQLSKYECQYDTPILLPPSEDLKVQLKSATYKPNARGRIQIASKDEMKKALKKSPDKLDAVLMAIAVTEELNPFENCSFFAVNVKNESWT